MFLIADGEWCTQLCRKCGRNDPPRDKQKSILKITEWVMFNNRLMKDTLF